MRSKISAIITACGVLLLGLMIFAGTALAAGEVKPDDGSLLDLARPIYNAVVGGHYAFAAALALMFAVAAFRKYAPGKAGEFGRTDMGGALLVLLFAFGGALSTALAGGGPMTWGLAWAACGVAASAAGGFSLAKKILVPFLEKWAATGPAWLRPILSTMLWIFGSSSDKAIAKAEAAGAAAVAASPASGSSAFNSDKPPTEVP